MGLPCGGAGEAHSRIRGMGFRHSGTAFVQDLSIGGFVMRVTATRAKAASAKVGNSRVEDAGSLANERPNWQCRQSDGADDGIQAAERTGNRLAQMAVVACLPPAQEAALSILAGQHHCEDPASQQYAGSGDPHCRLRS